MVLVVVCVISAGAWYWFASQQPPAVPMPMVTATIGSTTFRLHAPATEAQRQRGLAAFDRLADDEGMLFRGLKPGVQSFWMKDMKFDIDILWVDEQNQIVHIVQAVSKNSYPQTVQNPSNKPSSYVVELVADACLKYSIVPGQTVTIHE